MTEALPSGIISNNTQRISSDLGNTYAVDPEDIAKLWRIYTTNKATLRKSAGRRLENLFWRIWGSTRILRVIRGATLAALFVNISNGYAPLLTDPSSLSREEETEFSSRTAYRAVNPASPPYMPRPSRASGSTASSSLSPKYSRNSPRTSLPPPILKKPRPSPDEPQSNAARFHHHHHPSGLDGGAHRTLSASPSPVVGSGSLSTENGMDKPRRKKTTFATEVTDIEAEILLPKKRKSSRPSSGFSSLKHSPISTPTKMSPTPSDRHKDTAMRRRVFSPPDAAPPSDGASRCAEFAVSVGSISPRGRDYTPQHTYLVDPAPPPPPSSQHKSPTSHPAAPATLPPFPQTTDPPSHQGSFTVIVDDDEPQLPQPSNAILVGTGTGFRSRFVEKQRLESRSSSFTNLVGINTAATNPETRPPITSVPQNLMPPPSILDKQQQQHQHDPDSGVTQDNSTTAVGSNPITCRARSSSRSSSMRSSFRQPESQLSKMIEQDRRLSVEKRPKEG
ncbi:hypothetical protein AJ80_09279 [Polytolypa hystricis UAMH7299]|uniref:Nitrogen regulatory protein areA GATA-like domain-containing protein n=1 Tax=Polytolypa hystricis (strain UAMH7299) TaxID=1447883 RepID=A0A2B7WTS6_POLH7|nr:hypothetical protein AJ80_09279 [Polytolypa hystricis UAMH7299]